VAKDTSKEGKKRREVLSKLAQAAAVTPEAETYLEDLRLALTLADQADRLTMTRFGAPDLDVTGKDDDTLVSDADKDTEKLIRDQLERTRPNDKVLGEEFGSVGPGKLAKMALDGERIWVIDPIDATANYVRGMPVWATLIGLVAAGRPALGVVSAPALGLRWFAAAGFGAWKGTNLENATRMKVSKVKKLGDAFLSYSDTAGWEDQGRLAGLLRLNQDVQRSRGFGDFWSYMLLAEGCVDIATEPELAPHDMVALAPIVTEAGGVFTDTTGKVVGPFGADALAANAKLHERVVPYLHPKKDKDK